VTDIAEEVEAGSREVGAGAEAVEAEEVRVEEGGSCGCSECLKSSEEEPVTPLLLPLPTADGEKEEGKAEAAAEEEEIEEVAKADG
jgi:hypothetical protein